MCRFPGISYFEWMLILPMAVPAYLMAYSYTDFLAYTGPFQQFLRDLTGWGLGDYWFTEVRSLGGAITMMTFVFFYYVYLMSSVEFLVISSFFLVVRRCYGVNTFAL